MPPTAQWVGGGPPTPELGRLFKIGAHREFEEEDELITQDLTKLVLYNCPPAAQWVGGGPPTPELGRIFKIGVHREFEEEESITRHLLKLVFYKCPPLPNELEADPQPLRLEGSSKKEIIGTVRRSWSPRILLNLSFINAPHCPMSWRRAPNPWA